MNFDILNASSTVMEAVEAAAVVASPTTPHGPHKFMAGNFSKRELMEQGVETLLNDWRYQVSWKSFFGQ
jgi:hypothetical protein